MNRFLITAFVKSVCPQISIIFTESEHNSFDFVNDCIYFNPTEKNDGGFLKHIVKKHNYKLCPTFSLNLWTILHEIGHYMTTDIIDFDEEDEENINYFDRQEEWLATEWAINFVKNHYFYCTIINRVL